MGEEFTEGFLGGERKGKRKYCNSISFRNIFKNILNANKE